ncbi:MAG: zinc metallopeptidase [Planctomycetota bacterium]
MIQSHEEIEGVNKVLDAAAMTYVAATIAAVAQLLYYAIRLGLIGGSDD